METLTKKEEQVMQILWKIESGFVKDVIAKMPEPKPPYNTVSSVVRILEQKGFVKHKAYGKTYEYFPAINKSDYKKRTFKAILKDYFEGSYKNVVSFMVNDESLSQEEIEEMKKIIDESEKE